MKVISFILFISLYLTALSLNYAGDNIAMCAKNQLGKRYQNGETGPSAFDEFGLVYYCVKVYNDIPCSTDPSYQAVQGKRVINALPGDVIYEYDRRNILVGANIYIGDNQIIYASKTEGVTKSTIYKMDVYHHYDYRRLW